MKNYKENQYYLIFKVLIYIVHNYSNYWYVSYTVHSTNHKVLLLINHIISNYVCYIVINMYMLLLIIYSLYIYIKNIVGINYLFKKIQLK